MISCVDNGTLGSASAAGMSISFIGCFVVSALCALWCLTSTPRSNPLFSYISLVSPPTTFSAASTSLDEPTLHKVLPSPLVHLWELVDLSTMELVGWGGLICLDGLCGGAITLDLRGVGCTIRTYVGLRSYPIGALVMSIASSMEGIKFFESENIYIRWSTSHEMNPSVTPASTTYGLYSQSLPMIALYSCAHKA